jgi:hypothetical protein
MEDADCIAHWDSVNNQKANYIPLVYPHPLISSALR